MSQSLRLPPLPALRAFESAARQLSFTEAAHELHITQGAVSRQVRALEQFLGVRLFDRFTRRIELTEKGRDYFSAVQTSLCNIEQATKMTMGAVHRRVTLDVLPTLCTLWLMPLLQEFTETHPHTELRIDSSLDPIDFRPHQADVAIRVGRLPGRHYAAAAPRIDLDMAQSWKDVQADFLFPDVLVPVMSRKLLSQGRPVERAADVLNYRLIHTANRKHAWGDWLAHHRLGLPAKAPSLDFGHFFMAIRAAKDCKGIAIVPKIFLESVLADTEMVCPLDSQLESAGGYYMLTRQSSTNDLAVQEIRRWILSVAERFFNRVDTEGALTPFESPSTKGILWPK